MDEDRGDQPHRYPRQSLDRDVHAQVDDAVEDDQDADDREHQPPVTHQSTSICETHLVLRSSGRFGAMSRNG